MDWKPAKINQDGTVKIPERWLHLYYYESLNILFRFENALRIFVYIVLKHNNGKDWDLAVIGENQTIRTETKKRIRQAREHGYLGDDVSSPMLFLNSGELTQIITSETYWKYFASFFKASKSIVATKLQEIGTVRNALAHFRPIKEDDIDLLKQNSKHLFISVENCLVQITGITDVVPTNTSDVWYRDLKNIGNDRFRTSLFASRDQAWVRLELEYSIPMLKKLYYTDDYISYRVGNLRTAQLLTKYSALRESCIYLSENPLYGRVGSEGNILASKTVSFVFSRLVLEQRIDEIGAAVRDIAAEVEKETDLILQDNLARGDLIESQNASANTNTGSSGNKYWTVSLDNLSTSPLDIDCVEYWGQRWNFVTDFISSVHQYPWMPSSVSKDELPF